MENIKINTQQSLNSVNKVLSIFVKKWIYLNGYENVFMQSMVNINRNRKRYLNCLKKDTLIALKKIP